MSLLVFRTPVPYKHYKERETGIAEIDIIERNAQKSQD